MYAKMAAKKLPFLLVICNTGAKHLALKKKKVLKTRAGSIRLSLVGLDKFTTPYSATLYTPTEAIPFIYLALKKARTKIGWVLQHRSDTSCERVWSM